mmetsp:Transcript_4403/g.10324  ORF Transcript_4403/g.10324 Transcript_4403/m.10324 type:complete len:676 (-) Transcript_4403:672-2699(-)
MADSTAKRDGLTDVKLDVLGEKKSPRGNAVTPSGLRVVIATATFHVVDGVTITLRKIIRNVKMRGGKVLLLTAPPPGGVKEPGTEHVESIPILSCCVGQADYKIGLRLGKDVEEKLAAFRPHVVHITVPDFACYAAGQWARENQIPLIATWHSNIHDYTLHWGLVGTLIRPFMLVYFRAFYQAVGITYVPSELMRRKMIGEGFQSKEIGNVLKVWGRGVDCEKFHPSKRDEAFRTKHGFAKDNVVVLWVGRCVVEKRPDVYIQVMKFLTKRFPDKVKGLIVGRGDFYNEMCGVKNCVGLGWQNSDDLPRIYASCDVLCFPSRVETFGNVTLEGMASGLPVVAADCCSSHLVESGVNGYAIKGLDNSGYQEAILTLINDVKLRDSMARAGRERAVRDFEITKVMDQMVGNYVEAANTPPFEPKKLPIVACASVVMLLECPYMMIHRLGKLGPVQWAIICGTIVLSAMYLYGGDEESEHEPSYVWMIGVALAIGAQLSGALAKVLFKYYYKIKLRTNKILTLVVSYVCIIILNPILGLAAYSFAAQSLLAPLSILNLVWNAVLANLMLGEGLSKANMVAYVLICSGCLLSSYFGIHVHKDYSYDELMGLFEAPMFRFFILVQVIIAVGAGAGTAASVANQEKKKKRNQIKTKPQKATSPTSVRRSSPRGSSGLPSGA